MDKTKKLLNKGTSVVKSHKIIVGIILLIVFSVIIYYTLFKKEKKSGKYKQKYSVSKFLFFITTPYIFIYKYDETRA